MMIVVVDLKVVVVVYRGDGDGGGGCVTYPGHRIMEVEGSAHRTRHIMRKK